RATITDRGETIQLLDSFDPRNYRLAYHITKGMPGITKNIVKLKIEKAAGEIAEELKYYMKNGKAQK
ncbi:MAG: hypothetical protein QMC21_04870, partial [Flavobacteriales bacterium]